MNKAVVSENIKESLKRGAELQEKVISVIVHYKCSLLLECVSCGGHSSDVIFFMHSRSLL